MTKTRKREGTMTKMRYNFAFSSSYLRVFVIVLSPSGTHAQNNINKTKQWTTSYKVILRKAMPTKKYLFYWKPIWVFANSLDQYETPSYSAFHQDPNFLTHWLHVQKDMADKNILLNLLQTTKFADENLLRVLKVAHIGAVMASRDIVGENAILYRFNAHITYMKCN